MNAPLMQTVQEIDHLWFDNVPKLAIEEYRESIRSRRLIRS